MGTFSSFIENLKIALSERDKIFIQDNSKQKAGVLSILFEQTDIPYILFTRRTEQLQNHKGQISFPGGAQHHTDKNLIHTALRETHEEIGIPPECLSVIGELDDMVTLVSNYVITPFVACLNFPHPFNINPLEVEEILQVPLPFLLNKTNCRREDNTSGEGFLYYYFYYYKNREIWGATARILADFIDVILRNKLDRFIISKNNTR